MDNEAYYKMWGHYPFWEDLEGYKERVKIAEAKYGTK